MDSEKSELHRLFEKLDAVSGGGPWRLERRATAVAEWSVSLRYHEADGSTPESAVRALLVAVLAEAELSVKQREESARAARDHVAEMRRLVEEATRG